MEHQSGLDANQKRQRITQDTGGWIAHPDPKHWLDNSSMGGGIGQHQPNSYQKDIWTADGTGWTPSSKHKYTNKNQLRSVERGGFSQSSSSDRLTDEQKEDLIAENIYDWWISGKSYKKWYADKFLQLKLEFEE